MTLLYFILVLSITIFIHELGHFLFAKKAGIYVYEFSLGMGPKIFSFKKAETIYALRLFPIGGFVQMAGEEVEIDEKVPEEMRMQSKTWMQRFLTVIAGVMFNFILAIFIFFILAICSGAPDNKPYLTKIYEGYPASSSSLQVGDLILSFNGKRTYSSDRLLLEMQVHAKGNTVLEVLHTNGTKEIIEIKAKKEIENGTAIYKFGFSVGNQIQKGFIPALKYAFSKTISLVDQMVHIIFYLCTGKLGIDNLSGPVGIYNIVCKSRNYECYFFNCLFMY